MPGPVARTYTVTLLTGGTPSTVTQVVQAHAVVHHGDCIHLVLEDHDALVFLESRLLYMMVA